MEIRPLRICLVITEDWYFWSHRLSLARYLVALGHDVHLVSQFSKLRTQIEAQGITTHSCGLRRTAKNPVTEAAATGRLNSLFSRLRPDVVHLVGMKPILYGSVATRLAKVPATVCAIAGLGWLFTPGGLLKSIARQLVSHYFRFALSGNPRLQYLVQNAQHRQTLLQKKMARAEQVTMISGAGVDTHRFRASDEPAGVPCVLTHARMLWDKGIGELVQAARVVRERQVECEFRLIGDPDPANPASISRSQLEAWNQEGNVRWEGRRDDIPDLLSQSHIACLPSHHEGFPLSVVEAMSCGRPVIATDIPGCQDAVSPEATGLLVPRGDVPKLADAIVRLVQDPAARRRMGRESRRQVLLRMSSEIVNQATLDCYLLLLSKTDVSDAKPHKEKAA